MALFDDFTDQDMAEHAAKHPATEPMILNYSHRGGFVAAIYGVPVGQIEWSIEQDEDAFSDDDEIALAAKGDHNGYYLRVKSLAVDEAFRRRGIATTLLARFIEHAEHWHGSDGWDPGAFTADGAAFWKKVRGEDVPVTQRITFG